MTNELPRCQRCHERPATGNMLSVLGPLDTREQWYCRACSGAITDEWQLEAPRPENDVSGLGPIDFAVPRASIRRSEADPAIPQAQFAAVAPELRRIADAHGQTLPDDIQCFIARHVDG